MTSGDSIVINEKIDSLLYDGQARVSRSATLDGGVVIDHQGYVAGDRTLTIKCELSADETTALRTIFENQTIVHVSTQDGFFTAAIERLKGDGGIIDLTILLKATA
jgi:archaeosine-15-forming tRNA-guanine transglycosylase